MRAVVLALGLAAVASAAQLRRKPAAGAIKDAQSNVPASWKALPKKVRSIEDTCKMGDMEPTKRQCQRSSCFDVMPKDNKRFCCCASMMGGWTFEAMGNCTAGMECPRALPAHLVRPYPSLREQLSYNTKLSLCAEHCVDACSAQGQQWDQQQRAAAANVSADAPKDALVTSLVELATSHMVLALATDRCEDRCIESCLQTAHPSITVGALIEVQEHARRTAKAVAPSLHSDILAIRRKIHELQRPQRAAPRHASEGAAAAPATSGGVTDPATGDRLIAPTYGNAPRFSSARAETQAGAHASAQAGAQAQAQAKIGAGVGHGAGAGAGSGGSWWTNPPPWWLPPPPEWGAPPSNIYSSFYSPYNSAQPAPQMAAPGGYATYTPSPLPY